MSENILEEALRIVKDRNQQYDHPKTNMDRTAAIWSVILGTEITAEQVALCMIGVKLAREAYQHKRDNLVDMAGYIDVFDKCKDKRS